MELGKYEEDAVWALFEYMACEDEVTVQNYLTHLRCLARMLHVEPRDFYHLTGQFLDEDFVPGPNFDPLA